MKNNYEDSFDGISFEDEIIREAINRPDPDREGLYQARDGRWMLDRRLTIEAIGRRGLLPRGADLNLIGPYFLQVPDYLAEELGI